MRKPTDHLIQGQTNQQIKTPSRSKHIIVNQERHITISKERYISHARWAVGTCIAKITTNNSFRNKGQVATTKSQYFPIQGQFH